MNDDIIKAFEALSNDILRLFQSVLESDVGINRKPMANGKNTLKNSRLANTAKVETDIPFFKLILNDYIDAIENGRRKKASLIPINDLRLWAKRKGIKSDNRTLMIIQYAIWRDGIDGRPVMRTFWSLLDKEWSNTYSYILYDAILGSLTRYFNEG